MSFKLKDCYFRKLKISDYEEFRKLFYSCFKKISFEFLNGDTLVTNTLFVMVFLIQLD